MFSLSLLLFCGNKTNNSYGAFLGNWKYSVADSMNFKCTIRFKNDSLWLSYDNFLQNNGIINGRYDSSDYALVMPVKDFNTQQKISGQLRNYWNGTFHLLNIKRENDSVLVWQIIGNEETTYLPKYLELIKFKN
jgi:hypothetical protein